MRIKKGSYRVATGNGWEETKGSYANSYPFYIHRHHSDKLWSVSHMATGYNIKKGMTLKHAKALVRQLKPFPLFLVPTIDTFTKQLEIMKEQQPTKHKEMITIIAKS